MFGPREDGQLVKNKMLKAPNRSVRLRTQARTCPRGWCLGLWTTSAASHSALNVGQSMCFCVFYWRTISPFGQPNSILCTCFFIYSQKEKKSCISIVHLALWFLSIFLAFVCVGMFICGNGEYSYVFCSCLVGPLLKPYGPPWAEKLGWKIQRDSLM